MGTNRWLNRHLKEFVKPYLGKIPEVNPEKCWSAKSLTPASLQLLLKVWEKAKVRAKGRTILLPGRDVWLVEVVAQVDGFRDTIFDPKISSDVAHSYDPKWGSILMPKRYRDCYVLDTGYSGTVPRALGVPAWNLISGTKAIAVGEGSGELAATLEGVNKYWTRGKVRGGKVVQSLNPKTAFNYAAQSTQVVARFAAKEL